ncbi:V-set and immunoglobulin domain-containing protein 10 [Hippocampus comes]|uniref:V-set and immunoglobulin domain-containing protein 10 n=1 Tax=Hippocampus comes TaxID=109280 RepID=UPI00094EB557|nr:PREDICTED: V-set and immunoglobulin domain-containing protein 10 [Hippocampus comes]
MGRRKGTWVVACVLATVAFWTSGVTGSPEPSESSVVTAAPGDIVHLPCYSEGSVMPSEARWLKDGIEVEPGGGGGSGEPRVQVLGDGSLYFPRVAEGDEGVYRCEATLPGNMTWRARVLLQVASGPENVSLSIVPSTALPNGTLVTHRGTSVSFHCTAASYPSQSLTWSFAGTLVDAAGGTPLASAPAAPWLDFRVKDIQPEAQGFYICLANNTLTHVVASTSAQLLVYSSARAPEKKAACSFTLEAPRPHASPLVWAQEGNSVTLACSESASVPPAITTWSRGAEGAALAPSPKHTLSWDGATYSLTIANVSRNDVGTYFCRSENALALRRAEVYLSVTVASDYTGVIVGIFVSVLIVGLAAVTARLLFANRHRICLGRPFGSSDGDRGDVLSLVESDEEQIFQAVPRLPPVTDPHPTTLVQVHRLPSGEQEDTGNPEAREEPPDLVTL